jgi:hypothetical protein
MRGAKLMSLLSSPFNVGEAAQPTGGDGVAPVFSAITPSRKDDDCGAALKLLALKPCIAIGNKTCQVKTKPGRSKATRSVLDFDLAGFVFNLPGLVKGNQVCIGL